MENTNSLEAGKLHRADSSAETKPTPEFKAYCEDCKAVKDWLSVVPYIKVKLCPLHAAAPALYEALKDVATQRLRSEMEPIDGEVQGDFEYAYDQMITVARAALALARGDVPE